MKYTIHGFSQQKAIEMGLDSTHLLILRWIVDFSDTKRMERIVTDDGVYFWVNYKTLLEDMPILDIQKRALQYKLKKLVDVGVLKSKAVIRNGTYSYYALDDRYLELVNDQKTPSDGGTQKITGVCKNLHGSTQNFAEGVCNKLQTKDSSTKETLLLKDRESDEPTAEPSAPAPKTDKPDKLTYGLESNVKMTNGEYHKLLDRYGRTVTDKTIDDLSVYLKSTGRRYQSHYATVLAWIRRDEAKSVQKAKPKQTTILEEGYVIDG